MVIYFQLIGYMALSALNDNRNFDRRLNVNGNNWNDNDDGHAFGIALLQDSALLKNENIQKNL